MEKPFVPTYKEAEELVALAQKQNKLLAVYQSKYYRESFPNLIGKRNRSG